MEKHFASDLARLFFVLSLFFAIGPQVRAQAVINWTKYDNTTPVNTDSGQASTNGKVPLGSNGKGDDAHTYSPSVLKDGATYKMWYSGHDGTFWRIYYATSADGLEWTKYDNNVPTTSDLSSTNGKIPLGSTGRGDDGGVVYPTVIKDGSAYKMWYAGSDGATYRIYYATSSNGLEWTKYDNTVPANSDLSSTNGRIPLGSGGKGDDTHSSYPFVLKDGATYKMWYGASGAGTWRIYYATSSNGLEWTKYDNTIPANSDLSSTNGKIPLGSSGRGDDAHTYGPWLLKDGTTYKMWYSGSEGPTDRTYYATSSNGLEWTKLDNTIPPASDTTNSNSRIGLGTAGKGDDLHLIKSSVVSFENGANGGRYYKMWYSGYDGATWRIYHATFQIPPPAGTIFTLK